MRARRPHDCPQDACATKRPLGLSTSNSIENLDGIFVQPVATAHVRRDARTGLRLCSIYKCENEQMHRNLYSTTLPAPCGPRRHNTMYISSPLRALSQAETIGQVSDKFALFISSCVRPAATIAVVGEGLACSPWRVPSRGRPPATADLRQGPPLRPAIRMDTSASVPKTFRGTDSPASADLAKPTFFVAGLHPALRFSLHRVVRRFCVPRS